MNSSNKVKLTMGIDTGVAGGIALYDANGYIEHSCEVPTYVYKYKSTRKGKAVTRSRNKIDYIKLAEIYHMYEGKGANDCVIEAVASRPSQSAMSTFNFGEAYGALKGMAAAFNYNIIEVKPQVWKPYYDLNKTDKFASLELAREIFPEVDLKFKKHHNKAEACLIAKWGSEQASC